MPKNESDVRSHRGGSWVHKWLVGALAQLQETLMGRSGHLGRSWKSQQGPQVSSALEMRQRPPVCEAPCHSIGKLVLPASLQLIRPCPSP